MLELRFSSNSKDEIEAANLDWASLFVGANRYVDNHIVVSSVEEDGQGHYGFTVYLEASTERLTTVITDRKGEGL